MATSGENKQPSSHSEITFNLRLNCTSRDGTVIKPLTVNCFPKSTVDLKKEIQRTFSIPQCIQTLSYQSAILSDGEDLQEKHIRSGDTLEVSYLCEADCEELMRITGWLETITSAIDNEDSNPDGDTCTDRLIAEGIQAGYDVALALDLFDWLDTRSHVNKVFFHWSGGLDVLVGLFSALLKRKWSDMPARLKYLESVCTQSVANFGETLPLRRVLLHCGILEMCFQSLLRKKLMKGLPVTDKESKDGDASSNSYLLQRVIENGLHIICNFSELAECQVTIASRIDVLHQVICISLSESFSCSTSVLAAEVFLCLAHSPQTHPHLMVHSVIDGLLDACRMRPLLVQDLHKEQLLLVALKCFTLMILAQLLLTSPELMPTAFIGTIHTYMVKFLQNANATDIRKYEENQVCVWGTLIPYVKLLYLPNSPKAFPHNPLLSNLQLLSIDMVLFFLHSKIIREYHRDVLVKEGLIDFVSCMTWHVPPESRDRARTIVLELGSHIRLQPPTLCNIAKAKLAKLYTGLEKVVTRFSLVDLVQHIMYA